MSTRALLALLSGGAFLAFALISLLAGTWFAFRPLSEASRSAREFVEWVGPLSFEASVSIVAALIISAAFFALVNRLVVRPLRQIHDALNAYVSRSERITLPPFASSPKEIQDLARVFSEFALQVEEAHARDMEISRIKSDFISTAAHQFRTPLTGIRWALEALAKEDLSESQKVLVKSAVDKSHDLVGIVGTLLDISSIESGKYKYDFKPCDLEALVTEVATDFLGLAERSGVVLTYVPTHTLPRARIDSERMKWVLNNLIENAIRYTPKGGSVTVSTESVGNRILAKVRDTGIGIKNEDRNNIFERFFRAGNAVAKENQGSGLGLYIARSIVKDHGGELSFEANQDGPGTTFILALPALA